MHQTKQISNNFDKMISKLFVSVEKMGNCLEKLPQSLILDLWVILQDKTCL